MCRYYEHLWKCSHVGLVFAAYCNEAAMIQKPCTRKHIIWQSFVMETDCKECFVPPGLSFRCERDKSQAEKVTEDDDDDS